MPATTAILVLSHGSLAKGLVEAACMIAGKPPKLEYVCLEEGEGPDSFRRKVDAALKTLGEGDVLFLLDLFGGTPSNVASMIFLEHAQADAAGRQSFALVTGVNLGMLLEAVNNQGNMGAEDLASHLLKVYPATIVNLGRVLLEGVNKGT